MMSNTAAQNRIRARIRNGVYTALACAALLLAQSCTDVFHELIPPSDSGIHSFSVANADRTLYHAAETGSTDITISVPADTDVTALVPVITLDEKSTVIPVTLPYIHRAFPSADLMSLAVQMNASQKTGGLGNWMLNFIRENKDFTVPPLDEPVDFSQPVMFCVIAGRGNYKLYTVTVVPEKTEQPTQPDQPSPTEPDEPETPDNPPVPPATVYEKNILSFVINDPPQTKPSVITEDTVTFYLNAGADRSALYPLVTVSEGAGLLPLTQEYLLRLFSYTELISLYSGYASATDISAFISATVKKLDADKIAKIMAADLSLPIDFSGWNSLFGVPFAVIGADKTAHVYSVSCVTDEASAALTAFAVTKIRNPGLMGDADVSFAGDTVTITATYPVEYRNFALIPDIVIEGDSWEITNGTLRAESVGTSGEEAEYAAGLAQSVRLVPGDAYPVGKEYTATLTVRRGEAAAAYTLRLTYKEDPDTIRSITDFRFLRLRNPGIKTTAMASISKSEDTGFISATVLYEGGEPPYELVADFYSPGTCTVNHAEQVSGKSGNNFQYDVQVLCTSKNKLFCRLYTVHVTFVKVKTAEAVLNYFAFPKHLNPGLSQSATGLIDESSGTVYVNAKYHTPEKPARLVPEFAATGTVTVNSVLQSSGYSAQDFSRSVYYAVRDQNEWSSDSRTYRVSVNWEQDEQSACAITAFGFSTADNPSLTKDVAARINERSGTIYALLPKGAGKACLAPYFSAQGTVTVDGAEQTSGGAPHDFSGEVIYTVTSANGLYSMQYAVSVQEAGPVIYVNAAAVGRNNGTCWQDAYITLDAAFEQAAAYGDAHKEIWIAHNGGAAYEPLSDEYRQKGLPLTPNTIIRGGFAGGETEESDRLRTKERAEERKKEFDVKTVKTAKDNKGEILYNTETTHYSIMEDAVCAVQTKLLQPNGSTDSHLFRAGTLFGEIVFDGIEMEATFEKDSYNILLDVTDMKDATLSLIDCTVRCLAFSQQNSEHSVRAKNIVVQNSDLYIQYLAADEITADSSRFSAQTSGRDCIIYGIGNYENCYFTGYRSLYQFRIGCEEQTVSVKKCFFDDGSYSNSSIVHAEDCHLKLHLSPDFSFIKDCFIEGYVNCHSNIDIEGSYIAADSDAFYNRNSFMNFSMKDSIVDYLYDDYYYDCFIDNYSSSCKDIVIELENSKITGFGRLCYANEAKEITMKNCSFDSKYNMDVHFITTSAKTLIIENCNFDLRNARFIKIGGKYHADGFLIIKQNSFKLGRKNSSYWSSDFDADLNGKIEFTHNSIESESSQLINLISSDSVTFTDNEFYGQWTDIKATNIKEFARNTYDNFVIYDITVGNNNKQPDFSTENIDIKKPLYTANGKAYTKKAYLTLTNGDITVSSDNFFCGYNLSNSDVVLSNQNLSEEDFPLYADNTKNQIVLDDTTEVFRYKSDNDNTLKLTNCIIKGRAEHKLSYLYNTEIENSDLDKYSLVTEIGKISNSTIHDLWASWGGGIISIEGSTINKISLTKNSLITTSFENTRRTKIKGIDTSWSCPLISLSDTDFDGKDFPVEEFDSHGMALFMRHKAESVYINNCTFSDYTALAPDSITYTAGAIYIEADTLKINESTFSNNTAQTQGGAIQCRNTKEIIIEESTFSGNTSNFAEGGGGAISCTNCESIIIKDSTFTNNKTELWRGGAVYIDAKDITLSNCTFTGNQSLETNENRAGGGAVAICCNQHNVTATIDGCTFSSNSSSGGRGHDVFMCAEWSDSGGKFDGCTLTIKNCTPNKFTKRITVSE